MLRIMDRYIGKQIISATIFGVVVLSAVMMMGNLYKELEPLMVESGGSYSLLAKFILSALPFSLIYTIPWGFLVAVLLVFGRLSAANELGSMRMAGVGLFRVALPVYILGLLLSAFSLWLNIQMAPQAKDKMKFTLYQAVTENPRSLLQPGVIQSQFAGQKIFIEAREGDEIKGLHMHYMDKGNPTAMPQVSIYAREAALVINEESKQIRLNLKDVYAETKKPDGTRAIAFIGEQQPLLFDYAADKKRNTKPSAMTNQEIREKLRTSPDLTQKDMNKHQNEIYRRYAFSVSCLALSLVAVPLGINGRRKETSTGIALSVLVGLGLLFFFMIADEFDDKDGYTALALFWLPNLLCLILGIFLFFKARRK